MISLPPGPRPPSLVTAAGPATVSPSSVSSCQAAHWQAVGRDRCSEFPAPPRVSGSGCRGRCTDYHPSHDTCLVTHWQAQLPRRIQVSHSGDNFTRHGSWDSLSESPPGPFRRIQSVLLLSSSSRNGAAAGARRPPDSSTQIMSCHATVTGTAATDTTTMYFRLSQTVTNIIHTQPTRT